MFLDVRNACDRWLRKRGLGATAPYGRTVGKTLKVVSEPAEKPMTATMLKRMKKYSSVEERKAAVAAKVKAYWATVSHEEKAKRLARMNGGRNV